MRAVVQRVTRASVHSEGELTGSIDEGLCVLVGVGLEDTDSEARALAAKVVGLRIFSDEAGKMNRDVRSVGGSIVAVSQFTLFGDVRKGRRPSFSAAQAPELAEILFNAFCQACRDEGVRVATGKFRTDMQVELVNDGPVTILVDTARTF